jgi:hypothetical protein
MTATLLGGATYRVFFRKMANGWDIADMYVIMDKPVASTQCDMGGALPRPTNDIVQPTVANQTEQQINDLIAERGNHPANDIVQPTVMTRYELHSEDHTADVVAIESLWSNYTFYNDTHNGPGMVSLFTDDAVVHLVWNNHGKVVPSYGINPVLTPDGVVNGGGCILATQKDRAAYWGFNRTAQLGAENHNGLAIPPVAHHEAVNKMVKVNDDGKTAMMTATLLGGATYRVFFRKMANGWDIADMYVIMDKPVASTQCDMDGALPRP